MNIWVDLCSLQLLQIHVFLKKNFPANFYETNGDYETFSVFLMVINFLVLKVNWIPNWKGRKWYKHLLG